MLYKACQMERTAVSGEVQESITAQNRGIKVITVEPSVTQSCLSISRIMYITGMNI